MLKIKHFVFNPIQENTYIAMDGAECAIIDPGMSNDDECEAVSAFIADNHLTLREVLCTHMHIDHVWGTEYLTSRYGIKPKANSRDSRLGKLLPQQVYAFGLPGHCNALTDFTAIDDGDTITFGTTTLKVIAVPGHSPGGLTFYCEESDVAFVGDSIFRGSIGGTDIHGGDHLTLINAIKTKLLTLPPDTVLLPGHDAPTSVQDERDFNPFIR